MLTGGPLPLVLAPALTDLFNTFLPSVRSEVEPERLFFYDFSLLSVLDTPPELSAARARSRGPRGRKRVTDGFRKLSVEFDTAAPSGNGNGIAGGGHGGGVGQGIKEDEENKGKSGNGITYGRWRRCVRCASMMQDVFVGEPKVLVQWMLAHQRKCFCSGNWVALPN